MQFIGVIDESGKRTSKGHEVFVLSDEMFATAFEGLIRDSYKDLFDLRAEDAWVLSKSELTSYFRTADKTSEVIGARQAGLFQAFCALAGHDQKYERTSTNGSPKPRTVKVKAIAQKATKPAKVGEGEPDGLEGKSKRERREMAMTVRIEINLPANGSQETYDSIFKSIRANLIDE